METCKIQKEACFDTYQERPRGARLRFQILFRSFHFTLYFPANRTPLMPILQTPLTIGCPLPYEIRGLPRP